MAWILVCGERSSPRRFIWPEIILCWTYVTTLKRFKGYLIDNNHDFHSQPILNWPELPNPSIPQIPRSNQPPHGLWFSQNRPCTAEMAFGLFYTGNKLTPNRHLSVSVRSDCFYNIIDQFPSIMSVDPEHTSVPLGPNWSLIRSARFQSLWTPIQTDRKNPRIGLPGIYIQARSMRKKIHCKL